MRIKGRVINQQFVPDNRNLFSDTLANWDGKDVELEIHLMEYARTLRQSNAIHLYCQRVADALNVAGFEVLTFFRQGSRIPFSKEIVKELMWKRVQEAQLGKKSTTQLTRGEVSKIYDVVNNGLAERGIHVDFPSQETDL